MSSSKEKDPWTDEAIEAAKSTLLKMGADEVKDEVTSEDLLTDILNRANDLLKETLEVAAAEAERAARKRARKQGKDVDKVRKRAPQGVKRVTRSHVLHALKRVKISKRALGERAIVQP